MPQTFSRRWYSRRFVIGHDAAFLTGSLMCRVPSVCHIRSKSVAVQQVVECLHQPHCHGVACSHRSQVRHKAQPHRHSRVAYGVLQTFWRHSEPRGTRCLRTGAKLDGDSPRCADNQKTSAECILCHNRRPPTTCLYIGTLA